MPAGIFQRGHLSVGLPVDDNVLAADRPRKQRVLDIDIPCGGVPGINREGLGHGITSVRRSASRLYTLSLYSTQYAWQKSAFRGIYVYTMENMCISRHHPRRRMIQQTPA